MFFLHHFFSLEYAFIHSRASYVHFTGDPFATTHFIAHIISTEQRNHAAFGAYDFTFEHKIYMIVPLHFHIFLFDCILNSFYICLSCKLHIFLSKQLSNECSHFLWLSFSKMNLVICVYPRTFRPLSTFFRSYFKEDALDIWNISNDCCFFCLFISLKSCLSQYADVFFFAHYNNIPLSVLCTFCAHTSI